IGLRNLLLDSMTVLCDSGLLDVSFQSDPAAEANLAFAGTSLRLVLANIQSLRGSQIPSIPDASTEVRGALSLPRVLSIDTETRGLLSAGGRSGTNSVISDSSDKESGTYPVTRKERRLHRTAGSRSESC